MIHRIKLTIITVLLAFIGLGLVFQLAHSQELPLITTITEPEPVSVGEQIHIQGQNLSEDITVFLEVEQELIPLSLTLESDTSGYAQLPSAEDVPPGTYTLIICAGLCTSYQYTLLELYWPKAISWEPTSIYNTVTNTVYVSLEQPVPDGESLVSAVMINDIASFQFDVSNDGLSLTRDVISFTVRPETVSPGIYQLMLRTENREGVSDETMEVLGPINPQVRDVIPDHLSRYVVTEQEIVFEGENLDKANLITLTFGFDTSTITCPGFRCNIVSATPNQLTLSFEPYSFYVNRLGDVQFTLGFPDGTLIRSEDSNLTLTIIDRIWPWDFFSSAYLVVAVLVIALITFTASLFLLWIYEDDHAKNKTVPNRSTYLSFVALTLVVGLILTGITSLLTDVGWAFLMVSLLVGINTNMPFTIERISYKFHVVWTKPIRYVFVGFILSVAWGIPILTTIGAQPQWAFWAEFAVMLITIVIGLWLLSTAGNRLEEKRNYLSDEQIRQKVHQTIWTKGKVSWKVDFENVPADRVEAAMVAFYEQHRKVLGLEWQQLSVILSFIRSDAIADIQAAFEYVSEKLRNHQVVTNTDVSQMVQVIAPKLGLKPVSLHKDLEDNALYDPPFYVFGQREEDLESFLPKHFPLIIYTGDKEISASEILKLKEVLNEIRPQQRFAILLPLISAQLTAQTVEQRIKQQSDMGRNLVVLNKQSILEIVATARRTIRESLMESIHKQVALTIFSPYVDGDPTLQDMFYGRSEELSTIYSNLVDNERSVIILSTRRQGKSSLLHAVRRQLYQMSWLPLYLDCNSIGQDVADPKDDQNWIYKKFYRYAITEWKNPTDWHKGIDLDYKNYQSPHDFPQLVQDINSLYPELRIVFLFDEIDGLLDYDISRNEPFFKVLRSLSNDKKCQFVFAGERTLQETTHKAESRFWNFAAKVKLHLFDQKTTRTLVVDPLQLIGVRIEQPNEVVDLIHQATDGHPYLLQFVCKRMLEAVSASGQRTLTTKTAEDAVQVLQNEVERNQSYINVFFAQANTFERIVATYLAKYEPLSYDKLEQGLAGQGFKVTQQELDRGLAYLELGHIIQWSDMQYGIKLNRFSDYLFARSPFERRMESLRLQFQQEQAKRDE